MIEFHVADAHYTVMICLSHPWGHGNHLFCVNVDGGNPMRSWRWGCLATLCNQFMFGVLTTCLDFACSWWHRFFSFMESKKLPTGVCLWDTAKASPSLLPLQHQQINSYSSTPPSHSLFLDRNQFLQSMEEFPSYTFYPSRSFIYILKPIHSSNVLTNAFFWDVSFLGNEH